MHTFFSTHWPDQAFAYNGFVGIEKIAVSRPASNEGSDVVVGLLGVSG